MKNLITPLFIAAALIAPATTAFAKDYPDGGVSAEEVAADVRKSGFKAEVTKTSAGSPLIQASFKAGDTDIPFQIYFYGCEAQRCTSIQYHVSFDGKHNDVAKWNAEKRFARAYTDKSNTIHIEYDLDVEKGANSKSIQGSVELFKNIVIASVQMLA